MLGKPAHSIAQSIVQDRHDLAAALRLAAHFDFHELVSDCVTRPKWNPPESSGAVQIVH